MLPVLGAKRRIFHLSRCGQLRKTNNLSMTPAAEALNHPDKHHNDHSMHVRFVKINDAYRTLIKPSSRHAYDLSIGAKQKLNPPQYTTTSTKYPGKSGEQNSYSKQHDFSDPFMWHNVKNGKQSSDNYYGFKGVKKVSNKVILWLIFAFTLFGGLIQVIIIRIAAGRRNDHMLEQSRKNSLLEGMLREKAKLYGNEHQIQVLKNSLKASYDFNDDQSDNVIDVKESMENESSQQ